MTDNMNLSAVATAERTDDLEGRFLTFFIGEAVYGVELMHVLEIINVQSITRAPGVAYYIKGIINLRGKIVPVVDVRLKLSQPEKDYDERTCIIVVNIHDISVGLIVDSVSEVVTVNDDQLSLPPKLSYVGNQFISTIAKFGDAVVLNIDIERFFIDELGGTLLV